MKTLRKIRTVLAAAVLGAVPARAFAKTVSGASFLRIDPGARPAAMGGAYTAVAADVNAMFYNPGGLAALGKSELGATHAEWLLGTKFDFVGYASPIPWGTVGLAVSRLGIGSQEGRGADRRVSESFAASDTAYAVSFGRSLGNFLGTGSTSLGGSFKFLQSRIGGYTARSQAVDVGLQHRVAGRPLALGVSVLNVGPGLRFIDQRDPLPTSISIGAAYRFAGVVGVAFDLRRQIYDQSNGFAFGTEYTFLPALSLRAGYTARLGGSQGSLGGPSLMNGLGAGFGFKIRTLRADYTFTPFGELGNVQRFSLGARFD